ncbi:hypothetical protein [Comamonas fluminis]|uniref:hypothetical protein n=1 Tax=Comamonas fluminis TaxID=2796366 RepID=UPI001C44A896|nr:hypothetical protein [Comamonas fluminis]
MAEAPKNIPLAALICHDGEISIRRAMHTVALDAANAWAKLESAERNETEFAQGVAKVYMATLRALASDFAPDAECLGERS